MMSGKTLTLIDVCQPAIRKCTLHIHHLLIFNLPYIACAYGLAVGLSLSMTLKGASVLPSLITLLLTYTCTGICVSGKGTKAMPTGSTLLYEIPSIGNRENGCRCLVLLHSWAQSTVPSSNANKPMAL